MTAGLTNHSGTLRAILIGVDRFVHLANANSALPEPPQLRGCVADATELRAFLIGRVGVPAENVQLLVAPHRPTTLPVGATLATAQNIRAAFRELQGMVTASDNIVVFYASHGVRLVHAATGEWIYGFAPTDVNPTAGHWGSLILGQEVGGFLAGLSARGATVSAIVDTCHSGSATRAIRGRRVRSFTIKPLDNRNWSEFIATHPSARDGVLTRGVGRRGERTSGWLDASFAGDWVVMSACCESELANESWVDHAPLVPSEPDLAALVPEKSHAHGAFTFAVLNALREADDVRTLTWARFYKSVRKQLTGLYRDQTPVLEGREEQTVFGGAWSPFAPGFTVSRTGSPGLVCLDGGTIQGLDAGATVEIHPPGATDSTPDRSRAVQARIDSAELARSTARLLPPATEVPEGSRARLLWPSPNDPPVRVLMDQGAMPEQAKVIAALQEVPDARVFLSLDGIDAPDVEVRPWPGEIPGSPDARGGWVIVPFSAQSREPSADDVIAYLPLLDGPWATPEHLGGPLDTRCCIGRVTSVCFVARTTTRLSRT